MVPRSSHAPRFPITFLLALAALLGVSYASPLAAQSPPERDGVRVSRSDELDYLGRAAADGSGGLLVAWARQTGQGVCEVRAQRLDRRGRPQWGDDGVAVGSMTLGQGMNLASDGDGGVFVVWYPNYEDVLVQHLDPSGVPLWGDGVLVHSGRTPSGNGPRAVPDGSGGTHVVWLGQKAGSPILKAAHVTAEGPRVDWGPIDLVANGRQHNYDYAVSDGQGGAIVAWEDVGDWDWTQNSYEWDIRLQRLGPDGSRLWGDGGQAVVAVHNQSLQEDKANPLIEDGKGGAYFSWMDNRVQYGDLYAGHITAAGVMDWGDGGIPLATRPDITELCASLGLLDGEAVVAWWAWGEPNGDATYVQRVSAAGTIQWGEGGTRLAVGNSPITPRMVGDGAGGMICAWVERGQTEAVLRLQRLDARGATQWRSTPTIRGFDGVEDRMPVLVPGDGGAFVVWSDVRGNGDIYAQFVNLGGHLMLPLPSEDPRVDRGGHGGMKLAVASPSGAPVPVEFELRSDSEARLELFDVTGRRVESVRLPGGVVRGSLRLQAAALRPGVYLVVLSQSGARVAKRVVISN